MSKQILIKVFSLLVLAAASTLVAKADTVDFTLTGEGSTYTFSLPSSPTPYVSESLVFAVANVPIIANGTPEIADVGFYANPPVVLGGLFLANLDVNVSVFGPQLFTGPTSSPTFLLGDFNLTNGADGAAYTLDVTDVTEAPSPVPEPSSMVLLGTGALAFFEAGRRKYFSR